MKPTRIDRRAMARNIIVHAIEWCRMYGRTVGPIQSAIGDRMMALAGMPSTSEPDEIDEIRGGNETRCQCDSCDRKVGAVARVGDDRDPDAVSLLLCRDCLSAALDLLPEPVKVLPCS